MGAYVAGDLQSGAPSLGAYVAGDLQSGARSPGAFASASCSGCTQPQRAPPSWLRTLPDGPEIDPGPPVARSARWSVSPGAVGYSNEYAIASAGSKSCVAHSTAADASSAEYE